MRIDNMTGPIDIDAEPIGRIAGLPARDKGKPVERRRRKATGLLHANACHAGWAAERNRMRSSINAI
jgi:hypothetical protein